MGSLTIRDLDEALKRRPRMRAASHGRPTAEEVRVILPTALVQTAQPATNLGERIRDRFARLGDVELLVAVRELARAARLPDDLAAPRGKRASKPGRASNRRGAR